MPIASVRAHRAPALPPEERRAAIVSAALPLLMEQGVQVTTRQIADAAGIAEGTIFRVFPDKEAVVQAVIDAAIDTSALEGALAGIDRSLPFERQLEAAVGLMQHRIAEIWRLLSAVPESRARRTRPVPPDDLAALVGLFEPERDRLRLEPVEAARALRAFTLASSHPALHPAAPLAPAQIVLLLLDGVRARAEAAPC